MNQFFSELLDADNIALFGTWLVFIGLCVGSFINVVAYRLPLIIEAEDALGESGSEGKPRISLAYPPSSCPQCGNRIRPWHNLPVVGWLLLRGRCADCSNPISIQYPAVELLGGVVTAICVARFGGSVLVVSASVLTWFLLACAVTDWKSMYLPDDLTLPLLWLGLLLAAVAPTASFVSLRDAVLGASAGYLVLWSVYQGFKLITGRDGMGHGDFKLLAAIGAWLGWQSITGVLLVATLSGIAFWGVSRLRGHTLGAFAFGPFLAFAAWITLLVPALQLPVR